ncbi:MAG: M48 family metallopeptidase [Candidatus Adiutrix sp.]|jgi:hypothetical protein|nr:M48 family metallopeptidase [Candidatus Adiutrix sp.]
MERVVITNLQSSEYEHPLDKVALETLKKIPLLPKVLDLCDVPFNSIRRMELLGSNLRITERQMPTLYTIMRETCDVLEVEEPLFYLISAGSRNAYTACPDKPIVCVDGTLVDILDNNELRFVIGHELAHIKSQHITYQSLGTLLADNLIGSILGTVPGLGTLSGPTIMALDYAYYEWYRAAEHSCDRGGYLACQNLTAACKALMKLAGASERLVNEMNLDEFIAQSKDFQESSSSNLGMAQKIILSRGRSHPWSVSRVHSLIKFDESGAYADILARKTPVKELSETTPAMEAPEASAEGGAVDKAKDVAKGALSGLSKGFGKFGKKE